MLIFYRAIKQRCTSQFHQHHWHGPIDDRQVVSMSKENIPKWFKTCTYISWEVSFSILQMSSCHVTCDSFYLTLTQLKSHQFRKTAKWIHYTLLSTALHCHHQWSLNHWQQPPPKQPFNDKFHNVWNHSSINIMIFRS